MPRQSPPKSLEEMLDRFEECARDEERVSVEKLMDAVGRRSFGPLILFAGIVLSAPGVGDIPGVSTLIGIYVLLVAGQLICGRDNFWLPRWLLDRSAKSGTVKKAASNKWTRKLSKLVDKIVTERLAVLVGNRGTRAVAVSCCVLAFATPLTEVVPFSGTGVGVSICIFGIAMVAQDGLMVILGFAVTIATLVAAIAVAG
ncbi:exopolysaccharide biosynthesis protein [Luteolibacter yonseiensis]|uniref:Exopolysaccharide biosynthesis protein n=3 Tax=Luteolibacter yonseiensis TaxID=1144680 RepID=A0A934R6L8_9BACT|nr:exopolysaccharide biosynthesis protein [Luteolibacter yonseiensis]